MKKAIVLSNEEIRLAIMNYAYDILHLVGSYQLTWRIDTAKAPDGIELVMTKVEKGD